MWQIAVFSRVVSAHILTPVVLKKITSLPSMKRRFWWQFLFCFVFSIIFTSIFGFSFKSHLWLVVGIGFFNSLGAYCSWRAIAISLSKTSLFTQADDIIGICLGYLFLNETQFLNARLIFGIITCFGAATLLMSIESNLRLMKFVATYSVIWGVAVFLFRYFAISGIPFSEFLVCWYGGTFLGASFIFLFFKEEELTIRLTKKEIGDVGILAILTWLSLGLGYWAAKLAPIIIYQPIFLVSEAICPSLIGFLIFKEGGGLTKKEKLAFLIGLIGIIAISLSF